MHGGVAAAASATDAARPTAQVVQGCRPGGGGEEEIKAERAAGGLKREIESGAMGSVCGWKERSDLAARAPCHNGTARLAAEAHIAALAPDCELLE